MKLSIIIIGDEILLGRVTDTNSGMIARAFSDRGWQVAGVRTVGDDAGAIRGAVEASLAESDLVISTGGLGPTRDDITKAVLMQTFGGELTEDAAVAANVEQIFARRGLQLNELTRRQALVPSSCRVIMNTLGTAPLMWFERDGRVLVAMPGVPFETRGMLPEVQRLAAAHFGPADHIYHREFTVTGITESGLAERLKLYEDALPQGYKLAYLPSAGEILLRLDSPAGADAIDFDNYAAILRHALGRYLAAEGKATPAELLLTLLRSKGYTLATAESCTGGNIAHSITAIAGCSDVYRGGVVSYANEVKSGVLGVAAGDIGRYGAVSESVVRQMAEGAARVCGADCAIATSGIAGPGGDTTDKPVGTVWMAVHTPAGTTSAVRCFAGDRAAVIDRATATAIAMLCNQIATRDNSNPLPLTLHP